MTSRELRARLVLALGLPLAGAACRETPPPTVPGMAEDGKTPLLIDEPASDAGAAPVACGIDEVHERFCALVDPRTHGGRAPLTWCAQNASRTKSQFEEHVVTRESLESKSELASFSLDAAATVAYFPKMHEAQTYKPCCYERCNRVDAIPAVRTRGSPFLEGATRCFSPPEGGTSQPAKDAPKCPAVIHFVFTGRPTRVLEDDAPLTKGSDTECCYQTVAACPPNMFEDARGSCQHQTRGRPLRENGALLFASTRVRDGWTDASAPVAIPRPAEVQREAARRWALEGAAEHASVAAFARLSLELMALGAPADLVDGAHAAAREEIRHATLAYGLASAFAGERVGPGPLVASPSSRPDLVTFAIACFDDGCVGETVAALEAARARELASPPSVKQALDVIAEDEARHAELSWRIVAWALAEGGTPVRERLRERVEALASAEARAASTTPLETAVEPLGLLSRSSAAAVRRQALRDVVLPCAEALLTTT